jgi:antitoxin component HigA of HigAB toxin-antitoxin module
MPVLNSEELKSLLQSDITDQFLDKVHYVPHTGRIVGYKKITPSDAPDTIHPIQNIRGAMKSSGLMLVQKAYELGDRSDLTVVLTEFMTVDHVTSESNIFFYPEVARVDGNGFEIDVAAYFNGKKPIAYGTVKVKTTMH